MASKKGPYRRGIGGYRAYGTSGIGQKFPCQCCGALTVTSAEHIEDDICPVCSWRDDPCYFDVTDEPIGPNETSLIEAQANFREFGACERRFVRHVLFPPHPEKPSMKGLKKEPDTDGVGSSSDD